MEEVGWSIFNGNVVGDEKGEFTYTGGRRQSVIDYVIGNERVKREVKKMVVGDKDSDHHPKEVWINGVKDIGVRESKNREREMGKRLN